MLNSDSKGILGHRLSPEEARHEQNNPLFLKSYLSFVPPVVTNSG
jgi:hypothetical protein